MPELRSWEYCPECGAKRIKGKYCMACGAKPGQPETDDYRESSEIYGPPSAFGRWFKEEDGEDESDTEPDYRLMDTIYGPPPIDIKGDD